MKTKQFNFGANDTVDTEKMQEEQYFLQFIVGLIRFHLDRLDDENVWKARFDVHYQWGGAGNDWVEIYSIENPDFCIAIGIAGGTLGYTIFVSGENGDDDGGESMDKSVVTMEKVNQFCKSIIDGMFVKGGFDKYEETILGHIQSGDYGYEPSIIP